MNLIEVAMTRDEVELMLYEENQLWWLWLELMLPDMLPEGDERRSYNWHWELCQIHTESSSIGWEHAKDILGLN